MHSSQTESIAYLVQAVYACAVKLRKLFEPKSDQLNNRKVQTIFQISSFYSTWEPEQVSSVADLEI